MSTKEAKDQYDDIYDDDDSAFLQFRIAREPFKAIINDVRRKYAECNGGMSLHPAVATDLVQDAFDESINDERLQPILNELHRACRLVVEEKLDEALAPSPHLYNPDPPSSIQ
jgi:hypothetical protein